MNLFLRRKNLFCIKITQNHHYLSDIVQKEKKKKKEEATFCIQEIRIHERTREKGKTFDSSNLDLHVFPPE